MQLNERDNIFAKESVCGVGSFCSLLTACTYNKHKKCHV